MPGHLTMVRSTPIRRSGLLSTKFAGPRAPIQSSVSSSVHPAFGFRINLGSKLKFKAKLSVVNLEVSWWH